ncbi:Major facilitator superfamily domain, general substrate transporter [Cordyceps fumosorosea ARSEF 2679]|uniref:Major facilitator superfamily domain, general substrate transporter n=1 Tax=Cordyceps fumosorosea (strain ARSEF 2679) TaxID=1081104 RepID=A0A167JTN1_CORFA|nr:Major facilitator superfamily domain, general substrate transporter [Cordyceps fumosorosea ARSEF 2679]OAA50739.1 Major facilitator superfamily domain, general substrate transporter [Cordyceps fumosorosea ARSEF 2679]
MQRRSEAQEAERSALLGDAARSPGGPESPGNSKGVDVPNIPVSLWRGIAIGLSLGILIFLQATNMSGMTMIQGQVADDLDAHAAASWFTAAYLIPLSSFASVAGRLATVFSPRGLVLPVGALFAAGALVTARATSFAALVLGRALAGTGGAGVLGLCVIFVLELTTRRRRGLFIALVNTGFTAGVAVGAVVYGALLPVMGWRPIFMWQIPVSLIGGVASFVSLPSSMKPGGGDLLHKPGTTKQKLARIDYLGAFLLASSFPFPTPAEQCFTIVLFLYSLAADVHPLTLGLSLASLAAFLVVEYRVAADPIIPLPVLSSRGVLLSCLAQLGLMTARWSLLFYAPVFALAVRGAPPAAAGSVLVPTNAGFAVGGFLAGALHVRRAGSFWLPCVVVTAVFGLSLFLLGLVASPEASLGPFVAVVFLNGLATGAALNYSLAHVLHLSHKDTEYVSTSLLGTFRGFGGSFGTSIGGGIFFRFLSRALTAGFADLEARHGREGRGLTPEHTRLVTRLLGAPGLVYSGDLSDEEQQVAISGYSGAIRGVWHAAALLTVAVVAVQAAAGWTAPGDRDVEYSVDEEDQAHAALLENEGLGEA